MKTQLRPMFSSFAFKTVEKSRPLELKTAVADLRQLMFDYASLPVPLEDSTRDDRRETTQALAKLQQQLTTVHTLISFCKGDLDMSNTQLIGLNILLQTAAHKVEQLKKEAKLVW